MKKKKELEPAVASQQLVLDTLAETINACLRRRGGVALALLAVKDCAYALPPEADVAEADRILEDMASGFACAYSREDPEGGTGIWDHPVALAFARKSTRRRNGTIRRELEAEKDAANWVAKNRTLMAAMRGRKYLDYVLLVMEDLAVMRKHGYYKE